MAPDEKFGVIGLYFESWIKLFSKLNENFEFLHSEVNILQMHVSVRSLNLVDISLLNMMKLRTSTNL